MNNPLRILQTLDRNLAASAEITLFGRAALALGYATSPAAFSSTHDVDLILPLSWLAAENENLDFWEAQQRTNAELQPDGLYLTHLFRELEIILTPDWLSSRVRLPLEFQRLIVFRPATLDLILTKMVDTADPGRRLKLASRWPLTGCRPLRPPPRTGREPRRRLAVAPLIADKRCYGESPASVRRSPRAAREGWARGGWTACNGSPGGVSATISAHPIDCQAVAEPPIPRAPIARIGG